MLISPSAFFHFSSVFTSFSFNDQKNPLRGYQSCHGMPQAKRNGQLAKCLECLYHLILYHSIS